MGDDARSLVVTTLDVKAGLDEVREQVDRILASDTFHAAEALRRLLRFLAAKTFSGEAEDLKEYSIGLDALGKPPTYDPNKDGVVRLQASRLRQKLGEYYRAEGRHDPIVVSLPRGRFKITWYTRNDDTFSDVAVPLITPAVPLPAEAVPAPELPPARQWWRSVAIWLGVVSLSLAFIVLGYSLRTRAYRTGRIDAGLSPELEELWRPFLSSSHHLIVGFNNPLFVRLQRDHSPDIVYHMKGRNSWDDVSRSPEFSLLDHSLGNPKAEPTYNMVERSTLVSTFVLSRFLAGRLADISLARSSELSWQQLSDNDVILLTGLKLDQANSSLPVRPAFAMDKAGIRNLQPRAGEPAIYEDPQDHQDSNGLGLELISMLPGPMGRTQVVTFSSNHAWGVICGVQALTDPSFARVLVGKLRVPSGKIPPYYQLVLGISYRDGTPTTATYVTHRVLTLK